MKIFVKTLTGKPIELNDVRVLDSTRASLVACAHATLATHLCRRRRRPPPAAAPRLKAPRRAQKYR